MFAYIVHMLLFFLYRSGPHRHLHSFPTRRSSDLARASSPNGPSCRRRPSTTWSVAFPKSAPQSAAGSFRRSTRARSEEHTSELQSPDQIVCRLLLEKKKKGTTHTLRLCDIVQY